VAFSPNGDRIVSGSFDRTVRVWDATTGSIAHIYHSSSSHVQTVAWLSRGAQIAASGDDGKVYVWDTNTGKVIDTYGNFGAVHSIAWSPLGRYLAVGDDRLLRVRDMESEKVTTAYLDNAQAVLAVAWSPDSIYIASGG